MTAKIPWAELKLLVTAMVFVPFRQRVDAAL